MKQSVTQLLMTRQIKRVQCITGLGGIAILALEILHRKLVILLFIVVFTKACKLTVLLRCFYLFHQFGFASTRLLPSVRSYYLASKEFLDKIKL